jgi:hypothetical protein
MMINDPSAVMASDPLTHAPTWSVQFRVSLTFRRDMHKGVPVSVETDIRSKRTGVLLTSSSKSSVNP